MTNERRVFWINPIQDPTEHGGYVPSVVTEGKPGHVPMLGSGDHARPIVWGVTLTGAKKVAEQSNADMGILPDQARAIVAGSMGLSEDVSLLESLRSLQTLLERNDVSTEAQDAALAWAIERLSVPSRPSCPYTVAYDPGEPERPYVAQYTEVVGRTATLRDAKRANMLHNNRRLRPADEPTDPRGSEFEFRKFAPRQVQGFGVLHIDGWQAGRPGTSYATALVVTWRKASEFCTHRLIWRHDDPVNTWILEQGDYDLSSMAEARENLAQRIAR